MTTNHTPLPPPAAQLSSGGGGRAWPDYGGVGIVSVAGPHAIITACKQRENEFLSKTILACLSGAQVGLIQGKKLLKKFGDTATLSATKLFVSK